MSVQSADIFIRIAVVGQPVTYASAQYRQFHADVVFLACEYRHRNWVHKLRRKLFLIDIQIYSHNTCGNVKACQCVLYEHSADFFVSDIDVVRPFHRTVDSSGFQIIGHS